MADEQHLAHAVDALGKPGELPLELIGALSNLIWSDLEAVEAAWSGLPSERKLDVLGQLSRAERTYGRLDFNAVYGLAMADADPAVRRMAAESVVAENGVAPLELLVRLATEDPEPRVREAISTTLGDFALLAEVGEIDAPWQDRLRTLLLGIFRDTSQPTMVRGEALASVGYLDSIQVESAIEDAVEEPEFHLQALRAMGHTANPDWLETLTGEAAHPDPAVRQEVARALGDIADERAAETVADLVDDPELEVRLAAIQALGEIGGEEAREALLYALEDDRPIIREAAEAALNEMEEDEDPLGL